MRFEGEGEEEESLRNAATLNSKWEGEQGIGLAPGE